MIFAETPLIIHTFGVETSHIQFSCHSRGQDVWLNQQEMIPLGGFTKYKYFVDVVVTNL